MNGAAESRFEPGLVSEVDEPVRRYFTHALAPGAKLGYGVQLTMEGRIKAGAWMPFEAEWQGDGRSFEWRARAGRPFRPPGSRGPALAQPPCLSGWSVAIAQTNPASSRAQATTIFWWGLPRAAIRRQRL